MIDKSLQFFDGTTDVKASATSEAIDLRQPSPDLGMLDTPQLHVTIYMTEAFAGGTSPKVTFELQDCDTKGGTYRTIATSGERDADATFKGADIAFPIEHRQFLKLKATTSGSPTAGKCFAAITDGTEKNPFYVREI